MSIKSKIQSLIAAANAKTGESDATLTDAVQTLVDGFGQGGGGGNEDAIISRSLSGSYTNSSVSAVGDYALNSCKQLTSVMFSAATTVGQMAFGNCSNLVTLSLPAATSIGAYLCQSDAKLETAFVPRVTNIQSSAFNGCSKLTTVDFAAATDISTYTFNNCKALARAKFPNVSTVNGMAFNECSSLSAVDFGVRVNFGGGSAFNNCSALSTLVLRGTTLSALSNVNVFNGTPFGNGGAGGTIYIPKALYDHLGDGSALDYKAATNWSTIDGYGTITWAQIEGSIYETQYADGTPVA